MALLLLLAWAGLAYADSTVCAECHRQIAESFARTGMGRSFRLVRPDSRLPEFDGGTYLHEASQEHFTTLRRDGQYYVRRYQTGADGKPANVFEEPVDYVIGSGDRAISYLHRTLDNKLVEFPVTWYPENGGHWGMSPAYDRPNHAGFSRQISYRCMFCHNAYPRVPPGPGDYDGARVFPSDLPEGIDCERCHGPGADHVAAARQGRSPDVVRAAIVNPARLTPERRLEVCMQCHLETTSSQLPGALARFNRGAFSYRPGEPLTDYMVYFDQAAGSGHDDKFELVSSAYRLRKSACFLASGGQLTCTSCHDPHTQPTQEEALHRTNSACNGCHQASVAGLVRAGRHTAREDCASCHMPKRRAADAIHITITDHRIQRPAAAPPAPPAVEENDGNTLPYAGEVAAYYPEQPDPVYSAVAQVKDLSNLPSGLARLEQSLAGAEPRFVLAEALRGTGQTAQAIPIYQQALRIEPMNWRFLYGLGQAWQSSGKPDLAADALERAIALAPGETSLLQGLGVAYRSQGRIPDAVRTFREALRRNPEDAAGANNLGNALIAAGDVKGAEVAFREAIRLQPETAVLHMNLAGLLMRQGKPREAAHELEDAIRCGPSTEAARLAWFARLAAGSVVDAQKSYESSLGQQLSEAHNNLGTAFLSMGNADAAIREYRVAANSDPRSSLALLNLGLTLAGHGAPGEARQRLEQALRLDPDLAEAHLTLGALLIAAGRPEEGKAHLQRAAESSDARIRTEASRRLRQP